MKYSHKEILMFSIISPGLCELAKSESLEPNGLYRIFVEHCFVNDLKGPQVESLRRCYKAYLASSPYRMTLEFDALIH